MTIKLGSLLFPGSGCLCQGQRSQSQKIRGINRQAFTEIWHIGLQARACTVPKWQCLQNKICMKWERKVGTTINWQHVNVTTAICWMQFLLLLVWPDTPTVNKYTYCLSPGSGNGKSLNPIQHIVPAGFSYSSPECHETLSCQRWGQNECQCAVCMYVFVQMCKVIVAETTLKISKDYLKFDTA